MIRSVVVAIAAIFAATPAVAQQGYAALDSLSPPASLAVPVSLRLAAAPLRTAIGDVARQANASIAFDPALAGLDRPVTATLDRVPAARALMRLLDGSGLQAMVSATGSIVLAARDKRDAKREIVSGIIREPDGPLAGVRVWLVGTRFETMTDQSGRFTFGSVPVGNYLLRALRLGFAPIARLLRVGTEPIGEMHIDMTPAAVPVAAVIVTPGYFGVMQPGLAAARTLTRSQIETVPQLGEDVYRTIGRLPGVSSDDYSAKFSIRGESSDMLYTTLDGLPLVEPYHLRDVGSGLSIVDLASLGQAEIIAGGPSAEFGDQTAGVFKLHSVEPRTDRARTSLGLSITNLRGMSQGGFANGKGSWLLSGRRGFLDLVFKLAGISDSIYPTYDDLFGKITYDLGSTRVGLHGLHAGDRMKVLDSKTSIDSRYRSDYLWLTAEGRVGARLREESVAWMDALDWNRRGGSPAPSSPADIVDRRALHLTGIRQDWSLDMGDRALLKFGGDAAHAVARYDYDRVTGRYVWAGDTVRHRFDTLNVHVAPPSDVMGAYVSQRVRPISSITLEAGARYDRASHTRESFVSPRFNASWQLGARTTVRGAYGVHAQSESVFGLQVEDGVQAFQPAERVRQASVGIDHLLGYGITLRGEAYTHQVSDPRSFYMNTSANVEPFYEAEVDVAYIAPTRARAHGVELSIERSAGRRVDWSSSYVISSTTMQIENAWVPRPMDRPRALRADWSYHPLNNSWRFTISGIRHTGWPFTPQAIAIDTIGTGKTRAIWVFRSPGELFSQRAAPYQRVDARWTRFIDTPSGRIALFVDIYNLLNNSNERDRYTNISFLQSGPLYQQGSRLNLPRIPSFGINWEF